MTEQKEAELLQQGVQVALEWLKSHPGRDACDAATAAIMNGNVRPGHFIGEFDDLGHERWPEFLRAVEAALAL